MGIEGAFLTGRDGMGILFDMVMQWWYHITMNKPDEIRITVRFPLKDIEKLRAMAVADNRSLNAEIVQAVQAFIARDKGKSKDAEKL